MFVLTQTSLLLNNDQVADGSRGVDGHRDFNDAYLRLALRRSGGEVSALSQVLPMLQPSLATIWLRASAMKFRTLFCHLMLIRIQLNAQSKELRRRRGQLCAILSKAKR